MRFVITKWVRGETLLLHVLWKSVLDTKSLIYSPSLSVSLIWLPSLFHTLNLSPILLSLKSVHINSPKHFLTHTPWVNPYKLTWYQSQVHQNLSCSFRIQVTSLSHHEAKPWRSVQPALSLQEEDVWSYYGGLSWRFLPVPVHTRRAIPSVQEETFEEEFFP